MRLDQITRSDLLWVGLNLLGAYLIATGGINAGSSAAYFAGFRIESDPTVKSFRRDYAVEAIINGSLTVTAGGIMLVVANAMCRPNRRGPEDDYSDSRRRASDALPVLTPIPAQKSHPPAQRPGDLHTDR